MKKRVNDKFKKEKKQRKGKISQPKRYRRKEETMCLKKRDEKMKKKRVVDKVKKENKNQGEGKIS